MQGPVWERTLPPALEGPVPSPSPVGKPVSDESPIPYWAESTSKALCHSRLALKPMESGTRERKWGGGHLHISTSRLAEGNLGILQEQGLNQLSVPHPSWSIPSGNSNETQPVPVSTRRAGTQARSLARSLPMAPVCLLTLQVPSFRCRPARRQTALPHSLWCPWSLHLLGTANGISFHPASLSGRSGAKRSTSRQGGPARMPCWAP